MKTEKTGKGGLIKIAKDLISQKKELLDQEKNLQLEYRELSEKYQPKIDEFQARAEELAKEFRRLYSESQEAYSSGDGASAKNLSLAGHSIEDRCKAINSQANVLRNELKSILGKIQLLRKKANDLQIQADSSYKQAGAMRKTRINNFGFSGIMTNDETEELLDKLPQVVFNDIGSIEYINQEGMGKWGNLILGGIEIDVKTRKKVIKIFKHDLSLEDDIKRTIIHEVSHLIFERHLTIRDRQVWQGLYENSEDRNFVSSYAIRSVEEDFCESFAWFRTTPYKLENKSEAKYNFIKDFQKKLEREIL